MDFSTSTMRINANQRTSIEIFLEPGKDRQYTMERNIPRQETYMYAMGVCILWDNATIKDSSKRGV